MPGKQQNPTKKAKKAMKPKAKTSDSIPDEVGCDNSAASTVVMHLSDQDAVVIPKHEEVPSAPPSSGGEAGAPAQAPAASKRRKMTIIYI